MYPHQIRAASTTFLSAVMPTTPPSLVHLLTSYLTLAAAVLVPPFKKTLLGALLTCDLLTCIYPLLLLLLPGAPLQADADGCAAVCGLPVWQ
jgi:hypothetical protein